MILFIPLLVSKLIADRTESLKTYRYWEMVSVKDKVIMSSTEGTNNRFKLNKKSQKNILYTSGFSIIKKISFVSIPF
jgi:hypothetical protein